MAMPELQDDRPDVEPLALKTALALQSSGLKAVPIHPVGAKIGTTDDGQPRYATGKEPIGQGWGKVRHTDETLRALWTMHPTAGVGIKLGKIGGVIDLDVDNPITGEQTLRDMFGHDQPYTIGWDNSDGKRHLLLAWDDRLAEFGKTIINRGGVGPETPGVEIRIGSANQEADKQFQTVCPPTPTLKGEARRWNGCRSLAPIPDTFFVYLKGRLAQPRAKVESRTLPIDRDAPSVSAVARYAMAALDKEMAKLDAAPEGDRNNQLNESAFALGQLVGAGALQGDIVAGILTESAQRAGLVPGEIDATIRSGLNAGQAQPRNMTGIGAAKAAKPSLRVRRDDEDDPDAQPDPLDEDATAGDLIRLNSTIRWLWKGWIPTGVLTIIGAEPGVGKTRFCADLLRRISAGLPWPDGSPMTCPPDSCVLWVPADNQHPELGTFPATFGFDPEQLILNATKRNPYTGTMLDHPDDLADFEARIVRRKPVMVFIDTSLNATDRSSHKPEDAKAFFKPLQEIATRTQTAIICVTHLNAGGKPLGRRITGQGRVVIQLEKPDPDGQPHRRKLYVTKSNDVYPVALGVTMGGGGNDYDDHPPIAPEPEAATRGGPPKPARLDECCEWLREQLEGGNARVSDIRKASEAEGFSPKTIYAARDRLALHEFVLEGRKWWQLTDDLPDL